MQNDLVNGIGAVPSCARLFNYLNRETVQIQNIENREGRVPAFAIVALWRFL
jgi:hypothetical protein